jgi:hypothetical protein
MRENSFFRQACTGFGAKAAQCFKTLTAKRCLFAFAAVFLLVAGGGYLLHSKGSSETRLNIQTAFEWAEFLPARPNTPSPIDWEKTTSQGHLATFDALVRAITRNTITPESIHGFDFIINDQTTLERIEIVLRALDGPKHNEAIAELYAELMTAPSNPDVLLEKLQDRISRAFDNADKNFDDNGRHFGWAIAINAYSGLLAYQNTSDLRFLELVATTLDRSLSYRDSEINRIDQVRGRVLHSWGGTRYADDGRYMTNITLAGRMSFVLCLFADIVSVCAKKKLNKTN